MSHTCAEGEVAALGLALLVDGSEHQAVLLATQQLRQLAGVGLRVAGRPVAVGRRGLQRVRLGAGRRGPGGGGRVIVTVHLHVQRLGRTRRFRMGGGLVRFAYHLNVI